LVAGLASTWITALAIVKLCCTCGAGRKPVPPGCSASTTHDPAPVNETVPAAAAHVPGVLAGSIENETASPEVAVAVGV
jgi:hypothetical protein